MDNKTCDCRNPQCALYGRRAPYAQLQFPGAAHHGVGNPKEEAMAKMLIMPQDWPKRLHEWVAIERGYFDEVGLEYRFRGSPPEWDELSPGGFVRQAHEELVVTGADRLLRL